MLDELEKGEIELTEEMIQSEEFIHSFVIIYRAVVNTYSREKIRYFARILKYGISQNKLASDEFEEFVQILDTLSLTELSLIQTLNEFEPNVGQTETNNKDKKLKLPEYWDEYLEKIQKQHNFSKEVTTDKLSRLNRIGLYKTFTGSYWGYNGDMGKTTHLFSKFTEWIELESESS